MSELIYSIRDIFSSQGLTACLPQAGCDAFWIPAYQRGYKWGADGKVESSQPVDVLLRDLKRAWQKGTQEYLLQAITVKKVRDEKETWVLEVIDGQQRLTTLFILLYALQRGSESPSRPTIATGKLRYSIRHQERSLDQWIREWMTEEVPDDIYDISLWDAFRKAWESTHQDEAFLQRAALRCVYEFRNGEDNPDFRGTGEVHRFEDYLLDHVKLLVNRVEPHVEGEVIFAALNSNRVPLTECELIKGVLLTRVARCPPSGRDRRYREILERRIQLGRKWDEIQRWANREDIRSFYFSITEDPTGSAGMMGILEMTFRQVPKDKNNLQTGGAAHRRALFNHIFEMEDQEVIFELLTTTYARLRDWYEKDETYHLIGYCLTEKRKEGSTSLLVRLLSCKTKDQARNELLKRRRRMLSGEDHGAQIDQLNYAEHSVLLRAIFLALSVFSEGHKGRFDFFSYAREGWSLEHIFPQTPFGKKATLMEAQKIAAAMADSGQDVLGDHASQEIAQISRNRDLTDLKTKVEEALKTVSNLHLVGNLCLLSSKDNAAMGCHMFNNKRAVIRERIANGSFVPRHTYEVFSKMIGNNDTDLTVWSKSDIENHTHVIKERIEKLLQESVTETPA